MAEEHIPVLSNDVFIRIASFLDLVTLARLRCVATRFTLKTVAWTDAGSHAAACEMHSVVDEGARQQVLCYSSWQQAMAPRLGLSWLEALRALQVQMKPQRFVTAGPHVVLMDNQDGPRLPRGALPATSRFDNDIDRLLS